MSLQLWVDDSGRIAPAIVRVVDLCGKFVSATAAQLPLPRGLRANGAIFEKQHIWA